MEKEFLLDYHPEMKPSSPYLCGIVPPHLLKHVLHKGHAVQRSWALQTLLETERHRGRREMSLPQMALGVTGGCHRSVFDAYHGTTSLPGKLIRSEGSSPVADLAVNEAYDATGIIYDFFEKNYHRKSIDGSGMVLTSSVHFGKSYNNAFWNGSQMVFGDGDGDVFGRFTSSLDVIGHELTHGVTQCEANLKYEGQSGALNESFSDVFGVMIKQWAMKQKAEDSDWLIGKGLFTNKVQGRALRSMKSPGTAYDDPLLGKDPQPAHMQDYLETDEDHGGVHINSGIPNHVFYLVAVRLGGYSWERAGKIWYVTLTEHLRSGSNFVQTAKRTIAVAIELFGKNSREHSVVEEAWYEVGVRV